MDNSPLPTSHSNYYLTYHSTYLFGFIAKSTYYFAFLGSISTFSRRAVTPPMGAVTHSCHNG